MTQSTEPTPPSESKQILDSIAELKTEVERFNDKFDNYQRATQSVVNLAFGLIASATIVTLATALFRR